MWILIKNRQNVTVQLLMIGFSRSVPGMRKMTEIHLILLYFFFDFALLKGLGHDFFYVQNGLLVHFKSLTKVKLQALYRGKN